MKEIDVHSQHSMNSKPIAGQIEDKAEQRISVRSDAPGQMIYTRKSCTTRITKNADGTIKKETETIEHELDGSSKTTKVVEIMPADGTTRTETTVKSTPPAVNISTDVPDLTRTRIEENAQVSPEQTVALERSTVSDKETNGQRNSTWWFWSRK